MALSPPTPEELRGSRLYGEALDAAGIAEWFEAERAGYAGLVGADDGDKRTGALHQHHALRFLAPRRYALALALGAADGSEYSAIAPLVDRFVAIEPGRPFWRDNIGGVAADYRDPLPGGEIDLPDAGVDLACAFGVLHHIPNVSAVLRGLARVMAPGAPLILREPIVSLGDFRGPRPGLTAHERGIPHRLMDAMLGEAGFAVVRKSFAGLPGLRQVASRIGIGQPWDSAAFVGVDALASRAMAWNARYWRPRLIDKAAPTMAYWLALRRPLS